MKLRTTFDAYALYEALRKDLDNYSDLRPTEGPNQPPAAARAFAVQEMRGKFLSKFVPRVDPIGDEAAFDLFNECNTHCRVNGADPAFFGGINESDRVLIGEFGRIFDSFWLTDLGEGLDLNWGNIALNARSGPGVSNGSRGTSFYEKFYAGPIAASSTFLKDLYQADLRLWPEECIAESIREQAHGPICLKVGSKVMFVPKKVGMSRLIATPPAIDGFYQLGFGRIIEGRLRRFFGIDLSTQPDVNREMARMGSLIDSTFGDGFATIDLSSASDCISLAFCGKFLPAEVQDIVIPLRPSCLEIKNPRTRKVEYVVPHMLSMMGDGFTFPFQTAVFAAAASAAISCGDDQRSPPRSASFLSPGLFSVFGDDIVIQSKFADRLLRLLKLLGFKRNPDKTFLSGTFRESCGMDFYQGHNVRPFFLKRLDSSQDLAVCFNRLAHWAARHLVSLDNSFSVLKDWIRKDGGTFLVPMSESDDAGVRMPLSIVRSLGVIKDPTVQSIQYKCWVAKPYQLRFPNLSIESKSEDPFYNPSGLLVSTIRGECRSGRISTRRPGESVYKVRVRVIPWWDYMHQNLESQLDVWDKSSAPYLRRLEAILCEHVPNRRVSRKLSVSDSKRAGRAYAKKARGLIQKWKNLR
jgi:hypothetical protein